MSAESREDPVLVRPYVKAAAESEAAAKAGESPETWPETAALPEEGDTLVQPAVQDDPPAPAKIKRIGLHPLARAGILAGGVALALGVVGYLIFGPGNDTRLPQPGTALPAIPGQAPLDPVPSAAASSAPASASARASASASASASVSPSTSERALVPVSPSASGPVSAPPADPTLAPPASDRTGAITAASGRCLARGGLFGGDGSPVQVAGCLSVSAQRFTLATDGTLRVSDSCAQATDDGTVRIAGCGDEAAGQWRAGPDGTLVNSSGGGCLTDPGRAGATTTVSECSGGPAQSWSLP